MHQLEAIGVGLPDGDIRGSSPHVDTGAIDEVVTLLIGEILGRCHTFRAEIGEIILLRANLADPGFCLQLLG